MKNQKQQSENNGTFLRLPMWLKSDYLRGKLTLDELLALVWLWWCANPFNGVVKVSYAGLVADFSGKYTKNHVNKILLALKRKKCLWFSRQQGRRSSFEVKLHRYPLSKGGYTDIGRIEQGSGRSSDKNIGQGEAESRAEAEPARQKLEDDRKALAKRVSASHTTTESRSTNNDNDIENDTENNVPLDKKSYTRVRDFTTNSYEEDKCKEIALALGEEHINPILKVLWKHGFHVIERAWGIYREDRASGKEIGNFPAYFQGIINKLTTNPRENNHLIAPK